MTGKQAKAAAVQPFVKTALKIAKVLAASGLEYDEQERALKLAGLIIEDLDYHRHSAGVMDAIQAYEAMKRAAEGGVS